MLWLREQLLKIPAEQQIFEIWNEPWDKMSPEDFAIVSQWALEVVLKDRPNAIVGPNLLGNTSEFEYDARVIKAGGLKGMKMVALHPYGSSENREWMRNYRAWLKEKTGTDMQIHITEFGSHSTPEGPAKRTEQDQANRVVRQALTLYAEGVDSLHPHWLGQTEANRTYLEDWFGFVRKDETPKPVLLAYANTAHLIDSHKYIGDVWYGPRVGAMLFEKNGLHTLALWTLGDNPGDGATKEVEISPGVETVEFVEIDGRSRPLAATGGKVKLTLTEAPVYLVGVSPDLAKSASKELRADLWPKPAKPVRPVRVAGKMKTAPTLDGKFEDWVEAAQLALLNPKVAGLDASGTGYVSWDDQYLYVGVDIRDNEVMNKESRAKLYRHDSLELFVSTEPRDSGSGQGPNDHQFFITPKSGEGPAIIGEVTDVEAGVVKDVQGVKSHLGPGGNGWLAEIAIPWSVMPGAKPQAGAKLTLDMRINDADTSHERFKLDPTDAPGFKTSDPSTWSYLELKD